MPAITWRTTSHPLPRCKPAFPWAGANDPLYKRYMEEEWGIPVHEDILLFEMLILEVFQAGLSWAIILRKRQAFRRAFRGFAPARIAQWGEREVRRLLAEPDIIHNRRKIEAAIANARAFCAVQKEFGSFARYAWNFVGGRPVKPKRPYRDWRDLPTQTPLARRFSADLRRRGFRFLGPVATYAFMQAVGLVDDRIKLPSSRKGKKR